MNEVISYNIRLNDYESLISGDYNKFYSVDRRNASFAIVVEYEDKYLCISDHINSIPIFYRRKGNDYAFSLSYNDLIRCGDTLNQDGVNSFIVCGHIHNQSLNDDIQMIPPGSVVEVYKNKNIKNNILHAYKLKVRDSKKNAFSMDSVLRVGTATDYRKVGLYLSGGIDSGLIAKFLSLKDKKVFGYTSAPRGFRGSDIPYALSNAIIAEIYSHHIIKYDTGKVKEFADKLLDYYTTPNGSITNLGIISLWSNSDIGLCNAIFGGQGSDTATGSVSMQYLSYFCRHIPYVFLPSDKKFLGHGDIWKNYLKLCHYGYEIEVPNWFDEYLLGQNYSELQKVILAGIFLTHIPRDGGTLSIPVVSNNSEYGNPYYNIDFIEYALSVSISGRISIGGKYGIKFDKKEVIDLGNKFFSKKTTKRKKAFTIKVNNEIFKFTDEVKNYSDNKLLNNDMKLSNYYINLLVKRFNLKT